MAQIYPTPALGPKPLMPGSHYVLSTQPGTERPLCLSEKGVLPDPFILLGF